ncbi:unnamed protein product [Gongylonema pulchrum]|uniref:E3 ubiquitin-protein ligase n=1 Tax=Gongylonema pulchrum TaxID=637853 RepID=A0A183DYI4_9BILA|nr:unnamed protein product [Gongylonema pulchrum]
MRPLFDDRLEAWSMYAAKEEKVYTLIPSDLYYFCRKEAESLHEIDALDLMYHFPFWSTFENLLEVLSYIFGLVFESIVKLNWIVDHVVDDYTKQCLRNTEKLRLHLGRLYVDAFERPNKCCSWDALLGRRLHLGRLYVDAFERPNKCCSWDALLGRNGSAQNNWDKIVFLLGNLTTPANSPPLLHYEELQNLLFYMGRALQLLLSQSPYRDLVVPWGFYHIHDVDAQDLLPTVVQFFAFKPTLLSALSSKHLKTGEVLSESRANDIALGLSRCAFYESYRALFWADFDLTLFDMRDIDQGTWQEVYDAKVKEYFPFKKSSNDMQPCSFAAIFGRSMSMSMYYSRLWAELQTDRKVVVDWTDVIFCRVIEEFPVSSSNDLRTATVSALVILWLLVRRIHRLTTINYLHQNIVQHRAHFQLYLTDQSLR